MPIYEYRCLKTGEIAEVYAPISDSDRKFVYCPIHTKKNEKGEELNFHDAERIPSRFNTTIEGESTRIFENPKTKEVQIAANKFDKAPKGFIEKELRGSIQRSKFENERNKQLKEIDEAIINDRKIKSNLTMKNRHSEINSKMSSFDHQTQALMKEAMNRSRKKEMPKPNRKEAGFQINHMDKSNLV